MQFKSGCTTTSLPAVNPRVPLLFPVSLCCLGRWIELRGSSVSPSVGKARRATPGPGFGLRPFLVPPRSSAAKSDQCGASLGAPASPPALPPPARGETDGGIFPGQRCLCLLWLRVSFVYRDTPSAAPSSGCAGVWAPSVPRCPARTERLQVAGSEARPGREMLSEGLQREAFRLEISWMRFWERRMEHLLSQAQPRRAGSGAAAGLAKNCPLPFPEIQQAKGSITDIANNCLYDIWRMSTCEMTFISMRNEEIFSVCFTLLQKTAYMLFTECWTVFVKLINKCWESCETISKLNILRFEILLAQNRTEMPKVLANSFIISMFFKYAYCHNIFHLF